MRVITLGPALDAMSACRVLYNFVAELKDPKEALVVKITLDELDILSFFGASSGLVRAYYRSRDQELELGGLGVAQRLSNNMHDLTADQFYMGGFSFDKNNPNSPEWSGFGNEFMFLPLLQVIKRKKNNTLIINYSPDELINFSIWRDHALSILRAHSEINLREIFCGDIDFIEEQPGLEHYAQIIHDAKNNFKRDISYRKVVLGRRNIFKVNKNINSLDLFITLIKNSPQGFSFLLDPGYQNVFFGVSPELLYRRLGCNFETESLAGTRPRSANQEEDDKLRNELFNSYKDQIEHALVSEHIEHQLKEFGATDLFASRLEIMALPYVQHLVKRYHGYISHQLSDEHIINALHPTPAVCGLDRNWALNFIREHEGFDRGFYAGPIGYLGKDQAEFAVAIRSALYYQHKLYVYAACGIVAESEARQEWEELTNKQKNIMSIFSNKIS